MTRGRKGDMRTNVCYELVRDRQLRIGEIWTIIYFVGVEVRRKDYIISPVSTVGKVHLKNGEQDEQNY